MRASRRERERERERMHARHSFDVAMPRCPCRICMRGAHLAGAGNLVQREAVLADKAPHCRCHQRLAEGEGRCSKRDTAPCEHHLTSRPARAALRRRRPRHTLALPCDGEGCAAGSDTPPWVGALASGSLAAGGASAAPASPFQTRRRSVRGVGSGVRRGALGCMERATDKLTDVVVLHLNVDQRSAHTGSLIFFVVQLDNFAVEAAGDVHCRLWSGGSGGVVEQEAPSLRAGDAPLCKRVQPALPCRFAHHRWGRIG